MDSFRGPSQPVSRGVKRAAIEEEKKKRSEKRAMKGFLKPRLTESARNPGRMSILIGRNDILVDPKNPQKILIPDDTQVKVEVKEEVSGEEPEERMEEGPSTSGFQDREDEVGGRDRPTEVQTPEVSDLLDSEDETETGMKNVAPSFPNQVSVKVEADIEDASGESDQSAGVEEGEEVNGGVGSNVGEATSQGECPRCRDLEERLKKAEKKMEAMKMKDEEKDTRIRKLELELESMNLSKKMGEGDEMEEMEETEELEMEEGEESEEDEESDGGEESDESDESDGAEELDGIEETEIEALLVKAEKLKMESGDTLLHVAARSGHLKAVRHLLSIERFRGDVNAKNESGLTPIMEAAEVEDDFAEIAKVLIANGADLDATNTSGQNAFFIAVHNELSFRTIIKAFGTLTSSIFSISDKNKQNVLHRAAANGDLKALQHFMSMNPDPDVVNARDFNRFTPIMMTVYARENFSAILDLLLKNGAEFEADAEGDGLITIAFRQQKSLAEVKKLVDVGAPWEKGRVLSFCIANGNVKAVRYFITKGTEDNAMTEGMSHRLLTLAAFKKRNDIMDILIKNGAKPPQGLKPTYSMFLRLRNILWRQVGRDSELLSVEALEMLSKLGVTWDDWMLHECAKAENWEAVRYCVLKGADVNSKDSDEKTALMRAVTSERSNPEIVNFLVAKGANVNEMDEDGFSVFHHAVADILRSLDEVKGLIRNGATWSTGVVESGARKESILHAAVRGGNPEVVKYFISKGVDVDARDNNGDTAFLLAVRERAWSQEMWRVLVNGGADPDATDKDGNTALLIKVEKIIPSSVIQVEMLVELGCDWKIPNRKGVTVLSKLEKEGDSQFLEYIKRLG